MITSQPFFWLVWNTNGSVAKRRHASEASALAEAERLALAHPGQTFVVLKPVAGRSIVGMQEILFNEPSPF